MMKLIRKKDIIIIGFGENKYNINIKGSGGISTAKISKKGSDGIRTTILLKITLLLLIT